ncbi:MAG TPA: hypothetical protein PKJ02_04550 [Candidatus Avimonas sp.]|jgi:hypothetical protein|nr:hypothetical protein [Candidatus Avimonas sp.]
MLGTLAVRRAVVTGVNATALKLQETLMDEMGCDLVETSAHAGARPSHAVWQGKIFGRSGTHPKYPSLVEGTGYGTGEGLGGWNCRHSIMPFFEGQERTYTQSELDKMNAPKYEHNGEKLSEYEATQKQRYIERQIRRWKREYKAMEAAGLPTNEAAAKLNQWRRKMDDFIEQTGLKRQPEREEIVGFGRSEAAKAVAINRELQSYQKFLGITCANGVIVNKISKHFVKRLRERGIALSDARNALTQPLKLGNIRKDGTQQLIGEKITVAINVDTGKIITAWPTGSKKAAKLKGDDGS